MQFERKVFPRPVPPVNIKFFVSSFSKFSIKFSAAFLMSIIFSLGEIFVLYFFSFTSLENKLILKLLKFWLSILFIFF